MTTDRDQSGLLRLPTGLLQRMRWLFLLIGLVALAGYGLAGTLAGLSAGTLWPLTVVASVALAGVWLEGYRRGRFTLISDLVAAAAIVLLGASLPEPRYMPHAIFASVWIRALHTPPGRVALPAAIYIVAFAVATAMAASPESPFGAYVLGRAFAAALFAAAFATIAAVLGAHDRTTEEDRRLRAASRVIAEAGDRAAVYAAVLGGARALLAETPGAVVEMAVGSSDDLTVVAEAGPGTGAPGGHVRLGELPDAVRERLLTGRAVEVSSADAVLWLALDLDPRQGTVYALPLAGRGTLDGAIVVGSDRPLDDEMKDDLQTLSELAALAVERQIQLEARRAGTAEASALASDDAPFERARASLGTAVAAAGSAPPPSLWPIPGALAARVRWTLMAVAIGLGLWVGVYALVQLISGSPAGPLQLIAVATPLWLGGWAVYGYRRSGFPLLGDVVVAALVMAVLLSTEAYRVTQFALFASVLFRLVYGSRQQAVMVVVLHAAALVGAVVLSPGQGLGAAPASAVVLMLGAMIALAAAIHVVAATLTRHERALVRGRVLRITGAHLVAATQVGHVRQAVQEGADALVMDVPGGQSVQLRELPAELRESAAGGPVEQRRASPELWRACGLAGEPGALYAAPLRAGGELDGALVVVADAPIDDELKEAVQTLAALAALAANEVAAGAVEVGRP